MNLERGKLFQIVVSLALPYLGCFAVLYFADAVVSGDTPAYVFGISGIALSGFSMFIIGLYTGELESQFKEMQKKADYLQTKENDCESDRLHQLDRLDELKDEIARLNSELAKLQETRNGGGYEATFKI